MRRRGTWGIGTLAVCLLLAASASASTGIGGTPGTPSSLVSCGNQVLFVPQGEATAPSYVIPASGVITSWSTMGHTGDTGSVGMKVVRPLNATDFRVTGTSDPRAVTPDMLNQFRARVPVDSGDRIALWTAGSTGGWACAYTTGNALDTMRSGPSGPEPAVGGTYVTTGQLGGYRINLSAQLEADADGDGYGDESQDACPAEPLAHDLPCDRTAPETEITGIPEKVKTKRKTAKVSISFGSNEPGSDFSCTLDGTGAPCSSPFTAKVKKGVHRFSVVATDAAGNADATPAEGDFVVVRKKPKRPK